LRLLRPLGGRGRPRFLGRGVRDDAGAAADPAAAASARADDDRPQAAGQEAEEAEEAEAAARGRHLADVRLRRAANAVRALQPAQATVPPSVDLPRPDP